jgi:hypothetical protein
MKGRWLFWSLRPTWWCWSALAFVYPHLMVSPGPVVAAHAEVATDCFACHKPWRGAACHAAASSAMRRRTSVCAPRRALRIVPSPTQPRLKTSFHQDLIEQDCMACHSDHLGAHGSRNAKPQVRSRMRCCAGRAEAVRELPQEAHRPAAPEGHR